MPTDDDKSNFKITVLYVPLYRHLMLKNFSIPMSAPNPASVTTNPSSPTSFRAILSARIEELPWAMLANGPAWTNTGVPSKGGGAERSGGYVVSYIDLQYKRNQHYIIGNGPCQDDIINHIEH